MDHQLRIGPGRKRLPIKTNLSFADQGGFAKAVELCNGSGLCRKRTGGTMCPSYMVTLDEAGHHAGEGQHAPLRASKAPSRRRS